MSKGKRHGAEDKRPAGVVQSDQPAPASSEATRVPMGAEAAAGPAQGRLIRAWRRLVATVSFTHRPVNARSVIALAALAWGLGLVVRLVWLSGVAPDWAFTQDGILIPATSDAFYYGSGVLEAIGELDDSNRRMPGVLDNVLIALGAAICSVTGVSAEWLMMVLPALLSGLVGVPLILIGRLLGSVWWGVSAALIAVIGYSYFFRSIPGYFDTDAISVTLMVAIAGSLMAALQTKGRGWSTTAALLVLASPWFHHGAWHVVAMFALVLPGYVLVFSRTDRFAWATTATLLVALLPVPWPAVLAAIGLMHVASRRSVPTWAWAMVSVGCLFVATQTHTGMRAIIGTVTYLLLGPDASGTAAGAEPVIYFGEAAATVIENAKPTLSAVAERIAGTVPLFVLSMTGYVLCLLRHRAMVFMVPLLALGIVLALDRGSRFTIYAVPVAALGVGYAIHLIASHAGRLLQRRSSLLASGVATLSTLGLVVPAVTTAVAYRTHPPLNRLEVDTMRQLGQVVQPGDYAIAWWDYGYKLWFYAGLNTLIDGMKNNKDTFIVSEALFTDSPVSSARLSRQAVERYRSAEAESHIAIVGELVPLWREAGGGDAAAGLARWLTIESPTPPDAPDIYYYLPWRMVPQASVVAGFRRAVGLAQTSARGRPVANLFTNIDLRSERVRLNRDLVFDASRGVVTQGSKVSHLRDLYRLRRSRDGRLRSTHTRFRAQGRLTAIALEHRRSLLFVDQELLNSVFVQMLVFENYDPEVFEFVQRSADAMIYRLKP